MVENTKIEWCDHTFNPWMGCQHVSPGCDHCYTETMMDQRYGKVQWGPHGQRIRTSEDNWKKPLHWNAKAHAFARAQGHQPRVFCASLADVFDNQAPKGSRDDLFRLIRTTLDLDWLLLTKRPQNIERMLPNDWGNGYPNTWLGITAEDDERYRMRWPIVSRVPAVIRFVSYEPAIAPLGSVDLDNVDVLPDWIICGGESGPDARRMKPAWARALRDECADLDIAFFMKQIGSNHDGWPTNIRGKGLDMDEWPKGLRIREFPSGR
jgi:protein gp37